MLESLYEKMIERKDQIIVEFDSLHEDIDIEQINRTFNTHPFKKENQDKTFISTDGSFNSKKYLDGILYAVGAVTLMSNADLPIKQESEESDVRIYPATNIEGFNNHISTYMEILELKNTLKTLKNNNDLIDYVLIDGSLKGQLNHFNVNNELNVHIKNVLNAIIKEFKAKLNDNTFDVELDYFKNKGYIKRQVLDVIKDKTYDDELQDFDYDKNESEIQNYYMGLELLTCITHLINNYSEKIICISKTSRTNKIYEKKIPDSAVLEHSTNEAGYTTPDVTDNKKMVRPSDDNRPTSINYPLYKDKIVNYHYITLFTRLEDKKHVIKVEIPVKDSNTSNITNNIENILDDLYSCSINGYPYILKKVHDTVVITNKFMERMEKIYEFNNNVKGREVLNY